MIHLQWLKMWNFVSKLSLAIEFFLISTATIKCDDSHSVEIEIESGRVRGKLNVTLFEEKPFYSFRGIPYAEKPINDLRFKVIYYILNDSPVNS